MTCFAVKRKSDNYVLYVASAAPSGLPVELESVETTYVFPTSVFETWYRHDGNDSFSQQGPRESASKAQADFHINAYISFLVAQGFDTSTQDPQSPEDVEAWVDSTIDASNLVLSDKTMMKNILKAILHGITASAYGWQLHKEDAIS